MNFNSIITSQNGGSRIFDRTSQQTKKKLKKIGLYQTVKIEKPSALYHPVSANFDEISLHNQHRPKTRAYEVQAQQPIPHRPKTRAMNTSLLSPIQRNFLLSQNGSRKNFSPRSPSSLNRSIQQSKIYNNLVNSDSKSDDSLSIQSSRFERYKMLSQEYPQTQMVSKKNSFMETQSVFSRTSKKPNFSVDIDVDSVVVDQSISFENTRNMQTMALPRYMRYSQLKEHQGTDAVKQLIFKSPDQLQKKKRQVTDSLTLKSPIQLQMGINFSQLEFNSPQEDSQGERSSITTSKSRINYYRKKFYNLTSPNKTITIEPSNTPQYKKYQNGPQARDLIMTSLDFKPTMEIVSEVSSPDKLPQSDIKSPHLKSPHSTLKSPHTTLHDPIQTPHSCLKSPNFDSKFVARNLGSFHFEKLLFSKGLAPEFEPEPPQKLKVRIQDVLEGYKPKKVKKNNKLTKLLLKGFANKLDDIVEKSKEMERKDVAERVQELIQKFEEMQRKKANEIGQDPNDEIYASLQEKFQQLLSLDIMGRMEKNEIQQQYRSKNKALMEIVNHSKDTKFAKQIQHAAPMVREKINMLIEGQQQQFKASETPSTSHNHRLEQNESQKSLHENGGDMSPLSQLLMQQKQKRQKMLEQKVFQKKYKKVKKTVQKGVVDLNRSKTIMIKEQKKLEESQESEEEEQEEVEPPKKTLIEEIIEEEEAEKKKIQYIDVRNRKQIVNRKAEEDSELSSIADSDENIEKMAGKRIFGPAGQKFREIVAKHFLSKSLQELEKTSYSTLNMGTFVVIAKLKQCIEYILNEKVLGKKYHNIGDMYFAMDTNMYENKFLQLVLADQPAFGKFLNLKQKDRDRIEAKRRQKELAILNQIEADQIAKEAFKSAVPEKGTNYTLNQLFHLENEKQNFYTGGKETHIDPDDEGTLEKQIMRKYFDTCKANNIVILPHFVSFQENTLYLTQIFINKEHAEAMRDFFRNSRDLPHRRIFTLVIDDCKMTDEVFALLLEGLYHQCEFTEKRTIKTQYLTTLSYSFNEFGPLSLVAIGKLIPGMVNFQFNNILKKGGWNNSILQSVIDKCTLNTSTLMKLRLSNVDMKSRHFADSICQILTNTRVLQQINFSWASLSMECLSQISSCLMDRILSLRSIDFSYNHLDFNPSHEENFEHSTAFVRNLVQFLSKSILINHLKLQGMDLNRDSVMQIVESVSKTPLLISLHLSDNDINRDYEYLNEVLNFFDLGEDDLHEANRSQLIQNMTLMNPDGGYTKQGTIDFKNYLMKILGFDGETPMQEGQGQVSIEEKRKILKDHILMGKQKKLIENFAALNTSQMREGLGRLNDNQFDQFVITRVINYPELIYNQKIQNDGKQKIRFFQRDAAQKWKLSVKNECILCDKHKNLIIFYDRTKTSKNPGLTEIKDQTFIEKLKTDFVQNFRKYQTLTPIICGSVVNRSHGMANYIRKLKMIRASLFTLMCISGSNLFISDKMQTQITKNAVIKFLEHDDPQILEELEINKMLDGWNLILDDKCNNNELTDVQTVNMPNLAKTCNEDIFIYSVFLPPGYHQLLIFDPETQRAFTKDVIVGMNHKDFYPEYPLLQDPVKHNKTVQNVWRHWKVDSEKDLQRCFDREVGHDKFTPQLFIKQEEDLQKCLQIMNQHMIQMIIYQCEAMIGSDKFPQVGWDNIWGQIEWVHANTQIAKEEKLFQGQVELQFISATKFDNTKGLKSALQRWELIEFIMRLGRAWTTQIYTSRTPTSQYLQHFLQLYVEPVFRHSKILSIRTIIHSSARLNELLFDNMKCLVMLYEEFKLPRHGYSLESAKAFFFQFPEVKEVISDHEIEAMFLYCQMTVLNEFDKMGKYSYLLFVEWLDMFCRVAYAIAQYNDGIEFNVYEFMEIVFEKYYSDQKWDEETQKLIDINYEVDPNEILQ